MRRARAVAGTLGLLVACGEPAPAPSPVVVETAGAEVSAPSGPRWAHEDDALSVRARALASRLEAHGALADDAIEARFFLAARGTRAIELEVPARGCRVLAALASGGMRDLDGRLFTPEGELVAEDVAPDPQPTIAFCAGEAGPSRLWLVLDAYDGSGSVLVASLAVPSGAIDAVADELGRTAAVARADRERDELARALARRGLEVMAPPVDVVLAPGQTVRVPLRARAGRCYAVLARPQAPLAAVSLRLLDLSGAPLVDGDRAEGALQRCEPEDVERAIEVGAPEGGTVTIVIAEAGEARLGGAPGLWLGALPRDAMGPAARPAARGSLARGETTRHVVRVGRGCTRLRARATEGSIARLGLETAGQPRAEARAPALVRCGPAGPLELRVTALGGAGSYAIELEPVPDAVEP